MNRPGKNLIYLFSLLAVAIFIFFISFYFARDLEQPVFPVETENELRPAEIIIAGEKIKVEIAETHGQRVRGLSRRAEIPLEGMFFIFEDPGFHGIWMKEMNFAIDIVWIGEDLQVVDIKHSVSPDTFPEVFFPNSPAKYVLEVSAGFSEEFGIEIGSQVNFPENFF